MNKPIPCEDCLMIPLCKNRINNDIFSLDIVKCGLAAEYVKNGNSKNGIPIISLQKVQRLIKYIRQR